MDENRQASALQVRLAVPLWFRQMVSNSYIGLNTRDEYETRARWRFMSLLLFPTRGSQNGAMELTRYQVAACEGRYSELVHGHRYSMSRFLDRFEREVGIRLNRTQARIPTLSTPGGYVTVHPDVVAELRDAAAGIARLDLSMQGDLVWMDTGEPLGDAVDDDPGVDQTLGGVTYVPNAYTAHILAYLSRLDREPFAREVHANYSAALEKARGIPSETRRDYVLAALPWIYTNPKPRYGLSPTNSTARVSPLPSNIALMPKEIRTALIPYGIEVDLRNAQFAIAGAEWNVPEIQQITSAGLSIWDVLSRDLGTTPEEKPAMKEFLYSMLFGMGEVRLEEGLIANGISAPRARQMMEHPLTEVLLEARREQIRAIEQIGLGEPDDMRVTDYFGTEVEMDWEGGVHVRGAHRVLAQRAQAIEVAIMESVIAAAEHPSAGFTVVLWQHDGVTVVPDTVWRGEDPAPSTGEATRVVRRVRTAVRNRLRQLRSRDGLEIHTDVEVSYSPVPMPDEPRVEPRTVMDYYYRDHGETTRIGTRRAYEEYVAQTMQGGRRPVGKHQFSKTLRALGGRKRKVRGTRYWEMPG